MTKKRLEYDRKKITPTNMNVGTWPKDYTNEHKRLNMTKIPIWFGHIQTFMFVVVILFRSSSNVHVHRSDLFGQVHIFRSYSFGHVDSVKRLFLYFDALISQKKYLAVVAEWFKSSTMFKHSWWRSRVRLGDLEQLWSNVEMIETMCKAYHSTSESWAARLTRIFWIFWIFEYFLKRVFQKHSES